MEILKILYVIGIGPGETDGMTLKARAALDTCDCLCGYPVYMDLLADLYPDNGGKEKITTPMGQEKKRCRMALEAASRGKRTALICGGDAGIYGMAGLILELSPLYPDVEIEIIPGVTAATAGAAVLGAPLGHDFCVISLSDILTPWNLIETRLRRAAEGGFAICLYNPASRKRRDSFKRACDILLEILNGDIICGWVRNIGRAGQESRICTLRELRGEPADMFTTVFVGSAETTIIRNRVITPRGYPENKIIKL